jgi:hypothetical protein
MRRPNQMMGDQEHSLTSTQEINLDDVDPRLLHIGTLLQEDLLPFPRPFVGWAEHLDCRHKRIPRPDIDEFDSRMYVMIA